MTKYLWIALFAVTIGMAHGQGDAWKEYKYAADGLAFSAPVLPTEKQIPVSTAAGKFDMDMYLVQLDKDNIFCLSVSPCPSGSNKAAQQILADARDGAIGNFKGKLIPGTEKPISIDNNPGIEFEALGDTFHVRAHMYVVGPRLYQILSLGTADKGLPPDTDRFFSSFHLLADGK